MDTLYTLFLVMIGTVLGRYLYDWLEKKTTIKTDELPNQWTCPYCKNYEFTVKTNDEASFIEVRENHLAVFHD